ncbi:hypothetical protein [Chroococcidiopsis sp. CCNUC1]|uniref:hypothetical protein n=1 Tax=Chroococcidiopsis sp. CCNUC1 TaxID=2653189 RepID=UPI002021352B|nr:hypothetical protein [Chroococcidiopsis sp. CCNUC1]URD53690.1 hypothetical protein M5J74_31815 [Chroococcidiopsis sp. CCNUC1]
MQNKIKALQQEFTAGNCTKAAELAQNWRSRLVLDCPKQAAATRESIVCWLVGEDLERFEMLDSAQLEIIRQELAYRYRLLQQRYLDRSPQQAYYNLMTRFTSLVVLQKICDRVFFCRDREALPPKRDRILTAVDVLQAAIQELLQSDRYMQQQIAWITQCTNDPRLRNALLLANLEEYCLQPIDRQPSIVYLFVNYIYCASIVV